jgi:aminocarboxymuconate-semialdehyde decarboxylase
MNIDFHSHYVTEECLKENIRRPDGRLVVQEFSAKDSGNWNSQLFEGLKEKLSDIPTRLKKMDRQNVDLQVLSPPPYMFYYWTEPKIGVALSKLQNDKISEICRRYPERFLGFGTVPMQDVHEANRELERLRNIFGLKGVIISSNINGLDLDNDLFYSFFEKSNELGLPVFVHPHDTAAAERMQAYYMTNLVGNPLDTSIAASRIIFSGLMEKLPNLKIFLAHGGGLLPYIIGRIQRGFKVRPECQAYIVKSPLHYFRQLYFDTVTHDRIALEFLVRSVGSEKVCMGSDYPYDMGEEDPVGFVHSLEIPNGAKDNILGENVRQLLNL